MKRYKLLIFDFIIIITLLIMAILLVAYGQLKWQQATIVFLVIYGINVIFTIYLLIQNDELQEKFSWMFFLVIFPVVSHIIFILFRIRRLPIIKREKYEQILNEFKLDDSKNLNNKDALPIIKNYSLVTGNSFHESNIKIFKHGFEAYDHLFDDINKAQKYIHIEMYIIKKSDIFEKLKNLLIKKVKEGVEVKMIVDSFGSWTIREKEFNYLKKQGISIQFFSKTFYPYVRSSDNNRLHRKFFVIDGEVVHSGGINVSDEYSSYSSSYGYWVDLNFSLNGLIVNNYETIFLYDWYVLTNQKLDKNLYLKKQSKSISSHDKVLLFDEGPNVYENILESSIIDWIYNCEKSITIVTPYFIPSKQLNNALIHSLKKGIKINIYIPGRPDKKLIYNATKYYANQMIKLGANVYIVNNIFLHTKLMVFDNKYSYIGTNNLDTRSLYSNYELINFVMGKKIIDDILQIVDEYSKISLSMTISKESKLIFNLKKIIYELFSPLM